MHFILLWADIFFRWLGLTIGTIVIPLRSPSFFFTETSRSDGSKLCRNVRLIYINRKWISSESVILVSIWNSIIHPELIMTFHWLRLKVLALSIFLHFFMNQNANCLKIIVFMNIYIVISWVVKYIDLLPCSYWGVLNTTLCDEVRQWIGVDFLSILWNPPQLKYTHS